MYICIYYLEAYKFTFFYILFISSKEIGNKTCLFYIDFLRNGVHFNENTIAEI